MKAKRSRYHKKMTLFLPLLLLLLGVVAELKATAEMVCSICDEPITQGQYVTLEEQVYHKTCYDDTPRCKICGFPVLDDYKEDGLHQKFHSHCYKKASVCALCDGVISSGPYVKTESGKVYHNHCFKSSSKCALCDLPLDSFYVNHNGKRYHEHCFQANVKCDICQAPLIGEYFIDLYERKFCKKHAHRKQCSICKFPRVKRKINDGRYLCKKCNQAAIFHKNIALHLLGQVKKDLQKLLGLSINQRIQLHLVDINELKRITAGRNTSMQGKFVRETKIITVKGIGSEIVEDKFKIYILYGLPEGLFRAVLAHELTHAWQALHCREAQSEELKEGTAELVSYLYLKSKGEVIWMKRIENNEVDLYRESFKRAYQTYKETGHDRFFKIIKSSYSF
ncbi:protein DA1 [candidate division CSSED10-310 bacterium]|uniref:Protein DA1 n=1 Tax=candidate division CSSED10-310 bacterium TaxID=2855610 RepID=A0ABV6YV97_UNCC1